MTTEAPVKSAAAGISNASFASAVKHRNHCTITADKIGIFVALMSMRLLCGVSGEGVTSTDAYSIRTSSRFLPISSGVVCSTFLTCGHAYYVEEFGRCRTLWFRELLKGHFTSTYKDTQL